jgi:cell division protease FtsH
MAGNKTKKSLRRPKRSWFYAFFIIGVMTIYALLGRKNNAEEISWEAFKTGMLMAHDVSRIDVVNKETAEIYIKPDSLGKTRYKNISGGKAASFNTRGPQYVMQIGSLEFFEQRLEQAQATFPEQEKVTVTYHNKSNWATIFFTFILPLAILLTWLFFSRRLMPMSAGSSALDIGKSTAEEYQKGNISPITFKDVAGYDEAKVEIKEIVEFLKSPEAFTKLGAKIPKGVLLVGPPGTGKTLMAKAVAGEAAVPFFSLSGSELIEIFVGVGASRVRDLFDKAKEKAPSIIFIDEIDTIGRTRGKAMSLQANDERESTLNQLLAEMDGFDPNMGVIVLAATNRADILDPALLRAGRFDRHIYLELPTKKERDEIFKVHLAPLQLSKDVNSDFLAGQTPGFSGADIANVCNEAALIAARNRKSEVELKDFYEAMDRLMAGLEKKTKFISPEEKKIIAYHEAGHAITGWMLKNIDPLVKVSIIPRGKSLGSAWYMPAEKQLVTQQRFNDQLCATLGGRAAEEIAFGEVSSGALDDLEKVTKEAYTMVAQLGLSARIGNISFFDSTGEYADSLQKPYSEATAQLIDEEVRNLVNAEYNRAKNILTEQRAKLDRIAEQLLDKETVYKADIEMIMGPKA